MAKTRVGAQRIKTRACQKVGHPFVASLISLLEPRKGLGLFAKPRIDQRDFIATDAGFLDMPSDGTDFVRKPFTSAVLARKPRLLLDRGSNGD